MSGVFHAIRFLLVLAIGLAVLFSTSEGKRILGPRDPIAIDRSLAAGRALTLSDLSPPPLHDLDDPDTYERRFANSSAEQFRDAILAFVDVTGPALCESDRHVQLIAALRNYDTIKKYLSAEFHFRGPRASRFIDQAWGSSKDRQIEAFVQQLLERGYLRTRELSPRSHSFVLDVFTQEFGTNACHRS